nr:MAG TPA: hypothetical protein [Caudoviricetes sp.]
MEKPPRNWKTLSSYSVSSMATSTGSSCGRNQPRK